MSTVVLNFSRIWSFDKEAELISSFDKEAELISSFDKEAVLISSFDKEAELMVQHNDDKLLITHIFTNLFNIQHAVHT